MIEWFSIKEEDELFGGHSTTVGVNFEKFDAIPVECKDQRITPLANWLELTLDDCLKNNLERLTYTKPTPV
jgi:hypothetical protein